MTVLVDASRKNAFAGCLDEQGSAIVTVLGMTFKENVPDARNSKVADIVSELRSFGVAMQVHDPLADPREVRCTASNS